MKKYLGVTLFWVSSIAVFIIAISAGRTMISSSEMIEESTKKQMLAMSEAASLLVSAEELDTFMAADDMDRPEYKELKDRLDVFSRKYGIIFAYYMRLDTDTNMMQFIIDNVHDTDELDGLSSPQVPREAGSDIALSGIPYADDLGNYSDGWEGLLTAWSPVYYKDGTLSNMVAGVDAQDVYIKGSKKNTDFLALVLLISMAVLLSSCFASLMLYKKKARQAEAANRAKSSFLSRMSHEMRTPLNAIMGLCNMATESDEMATVKNYIDSIGSSSAHLRHLIDDVLDISKIESGKMQLELIPANLGDELKKLAKIIDPQMMLKNQRFTMTIGKNVPENMFYDTTHVRQVLVNLLSNAMKFTGDGGEISLSVDLVNRSGDTCRLLWKVSDNGIGIDEDSRGRLFVPFEQADVSTTRKYGGTGLGLSISKQLVEMMGGNISVDSEPGKGSVFKFDTLFRIARPDEVERVGCDASEAVELDLSGRSILLVEDSEINQIIAINMFEKYGATVETADNGREGLNKFAANPEKYDIIFMDIQMPVMDGYQAAKSIRESGAQCAETIPIVAMTANVFKEDIDLAFNAGMNGHIGKPLEMKHVKRVVERVLGETLK